VTLRRTLLLTFMLLGLLPSIALSWLSFSRTGEAMRAQISQSLGLQAQSLQADVDAMLFERFENALVWSRSELMQDLRLGDVDKRVSNYLQGLSSGYGDVYQGLDCLDPLGHVVASTRAAELGQTKASADAPQLSVQARLSGATLQLSLPVQPRLEGPAGMQIETAIPSPFDAPGDRPARLRLDLDPAPLNRLLDRAAVGRRVVVVLDQQGRWVAASQALRKRDLPDATLRRAGLQVLAAAGQGRAQQTPWLATEAVLGLGRSRASAEFAGSGWTTLVLEPLDDALAPVRAMAWIFVGLLALVLLATLLAASWLAGAIARPISALTALTQGYQQAGRLAEAQAAGSRITELHALQRAYVEMIHALERSRQELVRKSKLAMLGEMAAVLAHEVRTPLGILRSSAQLLLRDRGLSADSRELMGFVESETERLNRLVSTLLDSARPRQPRLARVDVHALLQRCAQMSELPQRGGAAPELESRIELDLRARDCVIEVDAEQLMQLIFNLLSNALQAVDPQQGRVCLSTADAGECLEIACADNGPGVPEALAERLFEPFVSQRAGGIGLGLAVVRQVVEGHGGKIQVGRSPWGGGLFSVSLPRRAAMNSTLQESGSA